MENSYPKPSRRVVLFAPYGDWLTHEQLNAVLASALLLRGADARIIRCDGVFKDSCYVLVHSGNGERDCGLCQLKGNNLFSAFSLPVEQIRSFITPEDWRIATEWADALEPKSYPTAVYEALPVGEWTTPIIYSYHRIAPPSLGLPHVQVTHRKYLIYSLVTYFSMRRYFDSFNPTNVIMCSGSGMVQGAVLHLARERNIEVLTHNQSRTKGSFLFMVNEITSAIQSRLMITSAWRDYPLLQHELERTKVFLSERQQGVNHNFTTYYSFTTDSVEVRSRLNIPNDAKIFALFTSSEYEKVYFPEYKDVPSQISILKDLFEVFAKRPEYLVVRHHPGIGGGAAATADTEFLSEVYRLAKTAPPNVRVVMPHEELTSYALLWHIDACISFFSTIGPEAVACGVPTAMADVSFYSPGVTHTIKDFSKASLTALVEDLLCSTDKFGVGDLSRFYRFMDALIYKRATFLQSCEPALNGFPHIKISSIDELREGRDPALDKVCDHILKGTSIYNLPLEEDRARPMADEEAFLRQELTNIRDHCALVRERAKELNPSSSLQVGIVRLVHNNIKEDPASFSAWLTRQRTQNYRPYTCALPASTNHQSTFNKILSFLSTVEEECVLLTSDCCYYDEHVLSDGLTYLASQSSAQGIWWALWNAPRNGRIEDCLFIERDKDLEFSVIEKKLSLGRYPELLLGVGIFRKEAIIKILQSAKEAPNAFSAAQSIYTAMNNEQMRRVRSPALRFSWPEIISDSTFSFTTVGTAFTCGDTTKTIVTGLEEEVKEPEYLTRIIQLAIDYINREHGREALKLLAIALSVRTDIPDVYYLKALAEVKMHDFGKATESLSTLLQQSPNHIQGQNLLAYIKTKQTQQKPAG